MKLIDPPRAPVASDAELKMSREVKVLQSRVEQLRGAVDQLKEKEKYQRYQVRTGTYLMLRVRVRISVGTVQCSWVVPYLPGR